MCGAMVGRLPVLAHVAVQTWVDGLPFISRERSSDECLHLFLCVYACLTITSLCCDECVPSAHLAVASSLRVKP